jgi:hypothetical protein
MGMFDYFRSSYNLGAGFTNVECQTKDLDSFGTGTMSQYWLDPHGYLYYADYAGTHDFVKLKEEDPEYSKDKAFFNFRYLPNGNKGRVKPCLFTGYVRIYPSQQPSASEEWLELGIFFKYGRLVDYEKIRHDCFCS